MHVRVVIPHYFKELDDSEILDVGKGFGSRQKGSRLNRSDAFMRCLLGLINFRHESSDFFLNHVTREAELVGSNNANSIVTIEIIVAIFSEKTCLKEVILKLHPFLRVLLCECEGDPTALGLKARDYLINHHSPADLNLYMEDDLVIHDDLFFDKILWVAKQTSGKIVLMPHRYEIIPNNENQSLLFVDGEMGISSDLDWHQPCLNIASGKFHERYCVQFDIPFNPHAGFFALTKAQLLSLDKDLLPNSGFVGPLETAATFTVGKFFDIWKPSIEHRHFFKIEHAHPSFLGYLPKGYI